LLCVDGKGRVGNIVEKAYGIPLFHWFISSPAPNGVVTVFGMGSPMALTGSSLLSGCSKSVRIDVGSGLSLDRAGNVSEGRSIQNPGFIKKILYSLRSRKAIDTKQKPFVQYSTSQQGLKSYAQQKYPTRFASEQISRKQGSSHAEILRAIVLTRKMNENDHRLGEWLLIRR
jgi:hypothetical protein